MATHLSLPAAIYHGEEIKISNDRSARDAVVDGHRVRPGETLVLKVEYGFETGPRWVRQPESTN